MNVLLKKLEENIFNTADLLDNLLEWSKSQLEGMIVKPEIVQLDRIVSRNLKILNAQILEKKLQIENNISEKDTAFADRNMINVVIRNIISNSIKFCNEGDAIKIGSEIEGYSILISVQDKGIGIEEEDHEKIFQLEHSITKGTSGEKGHHIGLVLCKDMVEQNKGRIWFESRVGVGTTFFIELPFHLSK
jgi:signal transduction histidine kinase